MEQQQTQISEELKAEMLKHAAFSQDTIAHHYDELATKYEEIYLTAGYHDPLKCAELVEELLGDKKESIEVFDMGCGTGLVGQYLKEKNIPKVVGVDASAGMLEVAKAKNAYTELKELFLGKPDTFPQEYHSRFDAITASGILAEGHLDNNVFDEMLLALKTGGYAIFATRKMYLTKYNYAEKIKALEDDGKWKLVKEIAFDRYDQMTEQVGRYTKVEIAGYAYQKL